MKYEVISGTYLDTNLKFNIKQRKFEHVFMKLQFLLLIQSETSHPYNP